jgi:Bifunctional DNA primase/polymerase, N-terminal
MARDFNRDWAMRLVEVGISVFPCGADPNEETSFKKPLVPWRSFSSADAEAIALWWSQFPGALPGIDLEKCDLVVLDGDRHGGTDGRTALRELLQQQGFDWHAAPSTVTPNDGVHVVFGQNGHELGNARGKLPPGIDVRGAGGYVIAPHATLSDGRCYRPVPGTPDLLSAYKSGTIPHIPQGVVDLIQARKRKRQQAQSETGTGTAGVREKSFAQAALAGCVAELAAAASGERNEMLNKIAYRLGHMVARGWLERTAVEGALIGAMHANGAVADDGIAAAEATLRSGLDAGEKEPHPDLSERDKQPASAEGPPEHPRVTLAEVHTIFRKWLGKNYDVDAIDAVLATAAAERLAGDPLWLLVVSGPGNAKTETVQSLSGAGGYVTSTITSEGALLSASPRRERSKKATGGLLRKIGDRGVLVIKDITSILSADRNTRAQVLAAIREIYDGRWERNVGSDGGQTLTWTGRLVIVGAVTTAWDAAHAVMGVMGDRFVLIRSDSSTGRVVAGNKAIRNTGAEKAMRAELAAAVGGIVGHIDAEAEWPLEDGEIDRLIKAADVVTYARTAVERDYQGDVIDAHAPEMPTRFAKQLGQMVRGGLALGMERETAMRLALRCARDSIPPRRFRILLDLADNPGSRVTDVSKRAVMPWRTARRELEALHMLGLLRCDEEQSSEPEEKTVWRYSLADSFDVATLQSMGGNVMM